MYPANNNDPIYGNITPLMVINEELMETKPIHWYMKGILPGWVPFKKVIPQKEAVLPLEERPSIAVISFENQTGDKAYDFLQKAIPNLLISNFA